MTDTDIKALIERLRETAKKLYFDDDMLLRGAADALEAIMADLREDAYQSKKLQGRQIK
jgi:hypothetical protein